MNALPPKWITRLLHLYCPDNLLEEIEGDLTEKYQQNASDKGRPAANRQYLLDVVLFCNPSTFQKSKSLKTDHFMDPYHPITMWKNYFTLARRTFWRHKETTLINLFGLSVGLGSCILIGLFALDEFSFDQYHPQKDRIFRIVTEGAGNTGPGHWAGSSPIIGPSFKESFPEVEDHLRLYQLRTKYLFSYEGQSHLENKGYFSESSVFDFFECSVFFFD